MTLPITAFLALCLATTIASKFTVTSNYVISKTAYQTFTRSSILTLKPTVTPTAEPVFETTSTRSHDDLEIVRRYFEPGELASTDIQTTSTPINTNIFTEYFQGVVYTAPTSCPTPFTVSVKKRINIPYEVRSQLHPTGLASTTYWYPDGWTSYTKVRAYLSDGAVPINDAETTSDWFATHYLANCQNPTATDDSSRGNVEPGNEPVLKAVAIIYGSIIAGLFSLGLVESFFWFQQMMVGEHAFRVATICWVVVLPPLLFFIESWLPRDEASRDALRAQWAGYSVGTKVKLWLRWGFGRWRPAVMLEENPSSISLQPRDSTERPVAIVEPHCRGTGESIQ